MTVRFPVCECGHPVVEHRASGWGRHSVCVQKLDDGNDGWHGVCPCVRRGSEEYEEYLTARYWGAG